jgi:hypothetical protein
MRKMGEKSVKKEAKQGAGAPEPSKKTFGRRILERLKLLRGKHAPEQKKTKIPDPAAFSEVVEEIDPVKIYSLLDPYRAPPIYYMHDFHMHELLDDKLKEKLLEVERIVEDIKRRELKCITVPLKHNFNR